MAFRLHANTQTLTVCMKLSGHTNIIPQTHKHIFTRTHKCPIQHLSLITHNNSANKILPIKTAMYPCLHISPVGTELLQTPRCTPPILIVKWGVEGNIIACLNA